MIGGTIESSAESTEFISNSSDSCPVDHVILDSLFNELVASLETPQTNGDDYLSQSQTNVNKVHYIESVKRFHSTDFYVLGTNSSMDNSFFTVAIPEAVAIQNPILDNGRREIRPCLLIPLAPTLCVSNIRKQGSEAESKNTISHKKIGN